MDSTKAPVIWFTGISGSGKSTMAKMLGKQLSLAEVPHDLLDGDEVRAFFESDLGYERKDRILNVRRIAFTAKKLSDHGVTTLVANIAPYFEVRDFIRAKIPNYIQIYMQAELQTVKDRDIKGLYQKHQNKELTGPLTGVDDNYDIPRQPDLILNSTEESVDGSFDKLLTFLKSRGIISS